MKMREIIAVLFLLFLVPSIGWSVDEKKVPIAEKKSKYAPVMGDMGYSGNPGKQTVMPDPTPTGPIQYINPDIPDFKPPEYPGEYYEAMVPATLDLAERARLSVNALTRMLNHNSDYHPYFLVFLMADPPLMPHYAMEYNMPGIYLENLPLVRLMSGSKQNLDVEHEIMKIFLKMRGPDGGIYWPTTGRPWTRRESDPEIDQVHLPWWHPMVGFCIYSQLDPSGPWREYAMSEAERIKQDLKQRLDAYRAEPNSETARPHLPFLSAGPRAVIELFHYGQAMDDAEAIEIARRKLRHTLFETNWYGDDGTFLGDWQNTPQGQPGGPGSFAHFPGRSASIYYGLKLFGNEDKQLLDFAHKAYNYAISQGEPLTGYFPEATFIPPRGREALPPGILYNGISETTMELCGLVCMIQMVIEFSKLGIDKWDLADRWIRNQLAESQLTQTSWFTDGHMDFSQCQWQDRFTQLVEKGWATTDRVAERCIGNFSGYACANDYVGAPGMIITNQNCCSAAGPRALFYAWKEMLTYGEGRLRVHLLLNRASKWADIDSHIPYTGRVDVRAKQDLDLELRLPEWVKPEESRCEVDGRARKLTFDGRYAIVGGIRKGQTAILNFPIVERTDRIRVQGRDYTIVRRGNEVVWIDPPGKYVPHYQQRGHYRKGKTLYRKVTRFIPEHTFDWW